MPRDELTDRVIELFPPLAEVKPWDSGETDEGEPVVVVEAHASFTGLDSGCVDLPRRSRTQRRSASGGSSRAANTPCSA